MQQDTQQQSGLFHANVSDAQGRAERNGKISGGRLTEADAIDIWIARWLRVRRKDLIARYGCDPRRLYEIWSGDKFPASHAKARALFLERYPSLDDRIDFGAHRTISRKPDSELQLTLFEASP